MKYKRVIILLFITITCTIAYVIVMGNRNGNLVGPTFMQQITHQQSKLTSTPVPTLAPPVAPKTFNFDSSVDLKAELEKVNPQILDSDFD